MKITLLCIFGAVLMVAAVNNEERHDRHDRQSECSRCTMKHRPVCGRNSHGDVQTFSNSCSLRRENCLHSSDFIQVRKGSC